MNHARQHFYGWKPSLPSATAYAAKPTEGSDWRSEVKDMVDPRPDESPVKDQGQLGSCTSNALCATLENRLLQLGMYQGPLSRLFLYYEERRLEGSVNYDAGAYGHDGFKVLRKVGVPLEELWPYDISQFSQEPPAECYEDKYLNKIGQYVHPGLPYSVSAQDRMERFKWWLTQGKEIAFGFTVYDSFESKEVQDTGIVPVPREDEAVLGGHEVLLVGYLPEYPDYGLVRNSWGTEWGLDGYCLMPWKVIASPYYADDWRALS
jgi:C1A family cysteine protease